MVLGTQVMWCDLLQITHGIAVILSLKNCELKLVVTLCHTFDFSVS